MGMVDVRGEMQSSTKNQYYAAIIVNILCFVHGCTMGWVSPALPLLSGPDTPLYEQLSDNESYLVASMTCISATIFTPIFGWVADKFGRKSGLIISAFPYLICWVLKLSWLTSTGIILARFMVGIGGAGIFMLSPIYCIEIASLEVKGTLGSFMSFSINIGILAAYILGVIASYTTIVGLMIPLPIVFLLLMFKLPETPSYLIKNERIEEAEKALSWLRSVPIESGTVRKEIEFLKGDMNLTRETAQESTWKTFKSSPATQRAFIVLSILLTMQIFMGLFAIISFAETIFNQSGTSISPSMCSIILGSLLLIGSFLASALIERLGRKILMIGSCLVVTVTLLVMGAFFYIQNSGGSVEGYGLIPVIALSLTVCTFAIGAGPIPYILPSEIFVLQVRGTATSILLTWVWFLSFIVALCFGPAVKLIGMSGVFFFFGVTSMSAIFLTIFCIPETKGKSVEESLAFYDKPQRVLTNDLNMEEVL